MTSNSTFTDPNCPMSEMILADKLFKNALLIDGTGAPGYFGDLAIADDRIVKIGGTADVKASMVIDVAGKVISPGFIDTHSHDDCALLRHPDMSMKVSQGVTTVWLVTAVRVSHHWSLKWFHRH